VSGIAIDIAPLNIAMQRPAILEDAVTFELFCINLESVGQTIEFDCVLLALLRHPLL
jgi:hypothetical protein